jgi:hypothetical protein
MCATFRSGLPGLPAADPPPPPPPMPLSRATPRGRGSRRRARNVGRTTGVETPMTMRGGKANADGWSVCRRWKGDGKLRGSALWPLGWGRHEAAADGLAWTRRSRFRLTGAAAAGADVLGELRSTETERRRHPDRPTYGDMDQKSGLLINRSGYNVVQLARSIRRRWAAKRR